MGWFARIDRFGSGHIMTRSLRAQSPPTSTISGMRRFCAALVIAALLPGLIGCADYDPPVLGDHTSEQYKADLEKCRTTSTEAVRLRNAATLERWIISPITGPPAVRAAIRTCMEGKKYVLEQEPG
jgi:hypothetical protein